MISSSAAVHARSGPRREIPNPIRLLFSPMPWVAAAFLLISFVIGTFWFVVLVSQIAGGVSMTFTLVGLPVLAVTMVLWTLAARAERWRVGFFFGGSIPAPYRPLPAGSVFAPFRPRAAGTALWRAALDSLWIGCRKVAAMASDPAVWRDLAYLLLLFPIGIAELVIVVVGVSAPLALVTLPAYVWAIPGGVRIDDSIQVDALPEALLVALIGLPFLLLLPYVLVGVANGHVALARALLGPNRNAELEARVDTLTETRSRAVDAALAERRRIERDLHDGAQQHLVALAMELGMARIKMDSDPAAARELVDKAHQEAKHALAEIRNLVRGIHPAVLTDRGLDAAVSALAGRCPAPVAVFVELDGRLPEAVESTAYFVVAEALTNVAKHSVATEAMVVVRREVGRLVVEVSDNGVGGAAPDTGSGLAGLADRVVALDGRLTVESPAGGPTRVRAEIPVARD